MNRLDLGHIMKYEPVEVYYVKQRTWIETVAAATRVETYLQPVGTI